MIEIKSAKFAIFPILHAIRELLIAAASGSIVGLCYSLLSSSIHGTTIFNSVQVALILGAIIGINIVALERYVLEPVLRRFSFVFALTVTAVAYSAIAMFWLWLFESGTEEFKAGEFKVGSWKEYRNVFLPYDLFFAVTASFAYLLLLEIKSLLAPDFLSKYLTGRYHTPREEERIFMFVDLRSSTTLAEQLGNYKYSCLLQEIFGDLTIPILVTKAEVYQYVGDEVILTWKQARGLRKNRCIECFFHIQKAIFLKHEKYRLKYGIIPELKAGMHLGQSISVCVGKIKKEIVYHGDVLNTAARIQSLCNQFQQDFIISESLRDAIADTSVFNMLSLEETELRGKNRPLKLYAVSERKVPDTQ